MEPGASHPVLKDPSLQLSPRHQGFPFLVLWLESWGLSHQGSAVPVSRREALPLYWHLPGVRQRGQQDCDPQGPLQLQVGVGGVPILCCYLPRVGLVMSKGLSHPVLSFQRLWLFLGLFFFPFFFLASVSIGSSRIQAALTSRSGYIGGKKEKKKSQRNHPRLSLEPNELGPLCLLLPALQIF